MPIESLRPNAAVRNVASIRIGLVAACVLGRELPKLQHNFCTLRSDFSRLGLNRIRRMKDFLIWSTVAKGQVNLLCV
jgi:hypothetical protein